MPLTDLGNAEQFVDTYGGDIRFCYDVGKWLIWKGNRWEFDCNGEIERKAKTVVRNIYIEAANAETREEKEDS